MVRWSPPVNWEAAGLATSMSEAIDTQGYPLWVRGPLEGDRSGLYPLLVNEPGGSRFSLPVGDGVGAMLGLAAGDAAGSAESEGYSATTQQAIVLAYHLLRHGSLNREQLAQEMAELDGDARDPSVFRSPSDDLRAWLDSVKAGEAVLGSDPSVDPAVRVAPVGMWFRRRPDDLIDAAVQTARLTHLDGPSAVVAAAAAGAVAAGCFAQNGRDMLMAITDVARSAAKAIEADSFRFAHLDQIDGVVERLNIATGLVGLPLARLEEDLGDDPVGRVVSALTLAAAHTGAAETAVEQAVVIGGSPLGALVGSIVGARVGIRVWPWPFPNDTWFVAVGQRLIAGTAELADLPVPYSVEQRVTYAPGKSEI